MTVTELCGYAFYNHSDDMADLITVVVFKNEKKAMQFMEQMGWTGEVESVSDYAGIAAQFVPMLLLFPLAPVIFVTPRIAESAIKARFVIAEHKNLMPKKAYDAASDKVKKKERFSGAWNWRDIVRDEGENTGNLFFLVFRKLSDVTISADSLLGALRPGEKYRTEIVAAGFGNRAAAIEYVGVGKPLKNSYPFVPASFKKLIKTVKIPESNIHFVTAKKGLDNNMILYEKRTGITMEQMEEIEEENQPVKIETEKADAMIKKELESAKKVVQ